MPLILYRVERVSFLASGAYHRPFTIAKMNVDYLLVPRQTAVGVIACLSARNLDRHSNSHLPKVPDHQSILFFNLDNLTRTSQV